MKIINIIAGLLYSCAAIASAADTNIYPILVTADGHAYTNSHIYQSNPLEVKLWHDGGTARVALTNLTEPVRSLYPYNSNLAAQFPALERQQAQDRQAAARAALAARQDWLNEQAKKAIWICITSADKKNGKYDAIINGQAQIIYLNNPPASLDANANFYGSRYMAAESEFTVAYMRQDDVGKLIASSHGRDAYDSLPRVRAFYFGNASDGSPIWQCVTSR